MKRAVLGYGILWVYNARQLAIPVCCLDRAWFSGYADVTTILAFGFPDAA